LGTSIDCLKCTQVCRLCRSKSVAGLVQPNTFNCARPS